ncbi:MAG TPA: TetR/AcrR family transcriptional regulator [Anaerolineae bacterium]|nr:TetR/AcrR family transcriptional regulator [Anaerolineae bacterium]
MLIKEQPVEGRVDPRARRTRELILKAFGELLSEKSFESITVQEIADRATVNRATFYAHFEDKYTLLDESFAELVDQVLYKKLPPGATFNPMNVQLLIQTICELLTDIHAHCAPTLRGQFDSLLEKQIINRLYQVLISWLKPFANSSISRNETELRATVSSWAIYAASSWWNQGARKESAAEFARRALPMIMAGLEAPTTLALKRAPARNGK